MSNRRLPLRLRLLDPRPAGHGASRSGRSRNARLANRARPARTDNQEDTVDQICSPTEQVAAISAFKNGASINAVASMLGKTPGSVEWLLKKNGLKRNDHKKPAPNEPGDSIAAPAAQSYRKADLAFQKAMHRAIKAGLEKPPMIGVYKDDRPLDAPRLFAPFPHSSGCTSPASDCADLIPPV
jgi:ubiquitin